MTDLLTTIEDERRRIAHEMHDGVGQSLTLLVSGLRSMNATLDPSEIDRRTGQLRELAQRALVDTKGLAAGLRPSLLDDLGLAAAIERVAVEVEQNHPLRVTVDVQSLSGQRLPERCETGLYRIFQEAISNVLQHSGATKASIRLTRSKTHVILDVADNGCGIEDARAGHKESAVGHLGLIGMAERATLLGGRLEIETGAGSGTNIRATIPL
ncbi:MAG: sensor histidine kinase [Planctomycetales bacterium]